MCERGRELDGLFRRACEVLHGMVNFRGRGEVSCGSIEVIPKGEVPQRAWKLLYVFIEFMPECKVNKRGRELWEDLVEIIPKGEACNARREARDGPLKPPLKRETFDLFV